MNQLSLSGALMAFSHAMQGTANNLANANTDGFKSSRVFFGTGPGGEGVRIQDVQQNSAHGDFFSDFRVQGGNQGRLEQVQIEVEAGNTEYAKEMVDLLRFSRSFEANTIPVHTFEETTGHILNLLI